jgi:hypothetical protein
VLWGLGGKYFSDTMTLITKIHKGFYEMIKHVTLKSHYLQNYLRMKFKIMKTKNIILKSQLALIGYAIIAAILFSCVGGSAPKESESTWKGDSIAADAQKSINDSSKIEQKKKSARLGYSYPSEMTRMKSYDINAYVSIVNASGFIKDTLMKIVTEQKDPVTGASNKDSVKVVDNILLYKRLKVELQDPDSAFKIKVLFGDPWQEVDSTGDNKWRWSVTPMTSSTESKLIIKVVAETPTGKPKDIDDRTFHIKIKITGFWQMVLSWWIYLQDNPGMVVTVILIPLIAYIGKRYFDSRSKKQDT